MNGTANDVQNNLQIEHLKEIIEMQDKLLKQSMGELESHINTQTKHLDEKIELIRSMSDKAVDKALESMLEKQEQSNHKYALLKEQHEGMQKTYPTRGDLETAIARNKADTDVAAARNEAETKALKSKVDVLSKFIWGAIGALLVLQVLFSIFYKK